MAVRIKGTVVGLGALSSGWTQLTVDVGNSVSTDGQYSFNLSDPTIIANFTMGSTVFIDISISSAEEATIAGAVTIQPITTEG